MRYAKIENNIVVQIQPNKEDGFIKVIDNVVCGQVKNEDGTYSNLEKTQEELDAIAEQEAKTAKLKALKELKVTTQAGNTFDANETARTDMLGALKSFETTEKTLKSLSQTDANAYIALHNLNNMLTITSNYDITHTKWKMTDDQQKTITIEELEEASSLAIQAKGNLVLGGN